MQGGATNHALRGAANGRTVAASTRIARAGAWTLVGLGVLVLLAWAFGFREVSLFGTPLGSMKANTALVFVLLGAALERRLANADRRVVRVLAGFATSIGVLSLVERQFDWQLGIDELIVRAVLWAHERR